VILAACVRSMFAKTSLALVIIIIIITPADRNNEIRGCVCLVSQRSVRGDQSMRLFLPRT